MVVLYIVHNAKMYGANYATLELLLDLKQRYGIKPIVLLPEKGTMTEHLEQNDIPYICIEFERATISFNRKKIRAFLHYLKSNIKALILIIRQLHKYDKINIIHTQTSVIDIGIYISKIMRIPHVWHMRECIKALNIDYLLPRCYLKHQYRTTNLVVAISNYIYDYIEDTMGINKNLQLVYDGVEDKSGNTGRRVNIQNERMIHFCIVGLICEGKKQIDVVRACNCLKKMNITNYVVYIIGDGKEEKNRIIEYIEYNHLQDNIKLLGYREDVHELLNDMDIGIMASEGEGFGRVTIEYMLSHMPVIASKSGANIELVQNNYNGQLYEVGNEEELAERMKFCIENRCMIAHMGDNAYQYAKANYSQKNNTDKIMCEYNKLLNRGI